MINKKVKGEKSVEIIKIHDVKGTCVETEGHDYIRYGPDCWYERMGESDEPVYNCEKIEALYQEYLKEV